MAALQNGNADDRENYNVPNEYRTHVRKVNLQHRKLYDIYGSIAVLDHELELFGFELGLLGFELELLDFELGLLDYVNKFDFLTDVSNALWLLILWHFEAFFEFHTGIVLGSTDCHAGKDESREQMGAKVHFWGSGRRHSSGSRPVSTGKYGLDDEQRFVSGALARIWARKFLGPRAGRQGVFGSSGRQARCVLHGPCRAYRCDRASDSESIPACRLPWTSLTVHAVGLRHI